jgi:hypothetical protein
MVAENPTGGAPRIHGELLKLGFDISERTVSRWVKHAKHDPDSAGRWLAFLRNHREAIAAMDFFTVPTLTFGVLYCFFVIGHDRRKILHCNVTEDYWHSIMYVRQQRVRSSGQNRARLNHSTGRVSPSIPQPGKGKQGIVLHAEVEWLFLFTASPPFEKPIGRKQAPTTHEGISERGRSALKSSLPPALQWEQNVLRVKQAPA